MNEKQVLKALDMQTIGFDVDLTVELERLSCLSYGEFADSECKRLFPKLHQKVMESTDQMDLDAYEIVQYKVWLDVKEAAIKELRNHV